MHKFYLFLIILLCSCNSSVKNKKNNLYAFADVLNIKGVPENASDLSKSCFSDNGAWMGFALPNDASKDFYGSFIGPFLMKDTKWISKSLTKFIFINSNTNEKINFANADKKEIHYFPGFLEQKYSFHNLSILFKLFFITKNTAIISVDIKNLSDSNLKLKMLVRGNAFADEAIINKENLNIKANFKNSDDFIIINFNDFKENKLSVFNNNEFISEKIKDIILNKNKSFSTFITLSHFFNKNDFKKYYSKKSKIDAEKEFSKTKTRWKKYLNNNLKSQWSQKSDYDIIPVKAVETLINNWRSSAEGFKHDGICPSYKYFTGFWAWDSWKHAVALANFAPDLAKQQIKIMFDFQDSLGMIADVAEFNGDINWRDTKPPLASWATYKVYEKSNDIDFIKKLFPKLLKYHNWWYKFRDHDNNGLCEYGSTDGSLIAAKWESGMDNAIRFDNAKMLKNSDKAWSMNIESVDLNSYLYFDKIYLSKMALLLKRNLLSRKLSQQAKELKKIIQDKMFDEKTAYFYDIDLNTKKIIQVQGPEGWIPLWTNIATKFQAEKVKNLMLDTLRFNTYIPLPTAPKNHEKFDPKGYWRGAIWLDQVYFGISGLKNYKYYSEANFLTEKIFNNLNGLLNKGIPIYENYNPLNGKGEESPDFSWSAAHLYLLYYNN